MARRELERKEMHGLSADSRQLRRSDSLSASAASKLAAVDRALAHEHPTADIDEMLEDIERGRGL